MRRSGVVDLDLGSLWYACPAMLVLAVLAMPVSAGQVPRTYDAESREHIAQEDDEVLLGTIDVKPSGPPAAVTAAPQTPAAPLAANPKPVSSYAQALRALEAGDYKSAEQLFEQTIAADPKGTDAADARRHLGQLYTAGPSAAGKGGVVASPPLSPRSGDASPAGPALQSPDGGSLAQSDNDTGNDTGPGPAHGPPMGSGAERFLIEAGDRVFFSSGSAELGGRARTVLAAQAAWLLKRPEWNVVIEGHADDQPLSEAEMEDLSETRAAAVRERLIAEGVAANRITIVSWGRQLPISDCQESGCQAQNRRAISVLTPRSAFGQKNSRLRPAVKAPLAAARAASTAQ